VMVSFDVRGHNKPLARTQMLTLMLIWCKHWGLRNSIEYRRARSTSWHGTGRPDSAGTCGHDTADTGERAAHGWVARL